MRRCKGSAKVGWSIKEGQNVVGSHQCERDVQFQRGIARNVDKA
jgi:hypothetical protein